MICAEDELGLGNSHEGIMVLEEDAKVGTPARDYFNVETDVVYEIALTPNRSDATSHIGVAKDLLAYFRTHESEGHQLKLPDFSKFQWDDQSLEFEVEIDNAEACPRYSGLSFTDVNIKESPDWIKNRLQAIGVRPINNVVDITNFVLHEYGQPLHAFDADKIEQHKVIIKTLPEGSPFITLDEQERKLSAEDLMICDGLSKPMCIGGVFGGIGTGVTDETKNIFLESAHFNAKWIRKTSMNHLLRTDAAMCFEKGSDPNQTVNALKRAALLFKKYADAKISSEIIDVYPKQIEPVKITLRYDNLHRLIGDKIPTEKVHDILRAMDMEIVSRTAEAIMVLVPTNKSDVTREVDLIEEILRIYGYNTVSISDKIHGTIVHQLGVNIQQARNIISELLVGNGFLEMMNLSLIESSFYKKVFEEYLEQTVPILNTSNIHLDIMRPEMLLPALKSVAHNHNRRNIDLKLFEWGRTYKNHEDKYEEEEQLILLMSGNKLPESWQRKDERSHDFYSLKSQCEQVFNRLGIFDYKPKETDDSRFDYGIEWSLNDNILVKFGLVNKEGLEMMSIRKEVFYAEFNMKPIFNALEGKKTIVEEMSKYPSIRRDLALVIDNSIQFEQIENIARKQNKRLIREINLFDVYSNPKHLGENKKSYAVSFVFEDKTKTLKDKEIDKLMNKLIQQYESELGAVIRK
jgi:phenylalanyl-tRNA synthetase beta chain